MGSRSVQLPVSGCEEARVDLSDMMFADRDIRVLMYQSSKLLLWVLYRHYITIFFFFLIQQFCAPTKYSSPKLIIHIYVV